MPRVTDGNSQNPTSQKKSDEKLKDAEKEVEEQPVEEQPAPALQVVTEEEELNEALREAEEDEKRKAEKQKKVHVPTPLPSIHISSEPVSPGVQATPVIPVDGATPSSPSTEGSKQLLSPMPALAFPIDDVSFEIPNHVLRRFWETAKSLLRIIMLLESTKSGFEGLEAIIDEAAIEPHEKETMKHSFKTLAKPLQVLVDNRPFGKFISVLNQELYNLGPKEAQPPITKESISLVEKKVTSHNFLKLLNALRNELSHPDFFGKVLVQLVKFIKLSSDQIPDQQNVLEFFSSQDALIDIKARGSAPLSEKIGWFRGHALDYVGDQHGQVYYNQVTIEVGAQLLTRLCLTLKDCAENFPPECKMEGAKGYKVYTQVKDLWQIAGHHLFTQNEAPKAVPMSEIHDEEKVLEKIEEIHPIKCRVEKPEKTREEIEKEIVLANLLSYISICKGTIIGNKFEESLPKKALENPLLRKKIAQLETKLIGFYLNIRVNRIGGLKIYLQDTIDEIRLLPPATHSSREGRELLKDLENLQELIDYPTNKYVLEGSLRVVAYEDDINPEHRIKRYIIQRTIASFMNLPGDIDELEGDHSQAIHEIKSELKKYFEDPQLLSGEKKEKAWGDGSDDNVIAIIIRIIRSKKPIGITHRSVGPYNNFLKIIARRFFVFLGVDNKKYSEEKIYRLFFDKPNAGLIRNIPKQRISGGLNRDARQTVLITPENMQAILEEAAREEQAVREQRVGSPVTNEEAFGGIDPVSTPVTSADLAVTPKKDKDRVRLEVATRDDESSSSKGSILEDEKSTSAVSPGVVVGATRTPVKQSASTETEPVQPPLSPRNLLSPRRVNFRSFSSPPGKASNLPGDGLSGESLSLIKSKLIVLKLLQLVKFNTDQYGWSEFAFNVADVAKELYTKHLRDGEKFAIGALHKLSKTKGGASWQLARLETLIVKLQSITQATPARLEKLLQLDTIKVSNDYDMSIKAYERTEEEDNFKRLLMQCIQIFDFANNPAQYAKFDRVSRSFEQTYGRIETYREKLSDLVNYGVTLLHSRSYFSLERFKSYIRATLLSGNWIISTQRNPIFLGLDTLVNGKQHDHKLPNCIMAPEGDESDEHIVKKRKEDTVKFLREHPVVGMVAVPLPSTKGPVVSSFSCSSDLHAYKKKNTILRDNLIKVLDVIIRNTQGKALIKKINGNRDLPDERKLKKYKTKPAILEKARILHHILLNEMDCDTPIAKIIERVDECVQAMRKDNEFFWGSEKFLWWEFGSEAAESLADVASKFGGKSVVNFHGRVLSQVININVSHEEALRNIDNHLSTERPTESRRHRDSQDSHGSYSSMVELGLPNPVPANPENEMKPQEDEVVLNNTLSELFQNDLASMLNVATAWNGAADVQGNYLPLNQPHQEIVADAALDAMRAYVTSLPTPMAKSQYGKALKEKVAKMDGVLFADNSNIRTCLAHYSQKAKEKSGEELTELPNDADFKKLYIRDYKKWASEMVILQAIVERAMAYVDKRKKMLGNRSSNFINRQRDIMIVLWRALNEVYSHLKNDKTKNSCKRDISAAGGIVPYLRKIINSKTHFAGVFDPMLAKGEFGNLLRDLDHFLNYISMTDTLEDTFCARKTLIPA